ncbi:unnamed protein product [Arabis nemorensis]|uniref:RRM domain-containing protein n=1 Tax=Arabis nemorensis TaxID=586526 RepID=A0A565ANN2_9BRAS|nr:unnamed protein product [Arabis nemorensis]
MANEEEVKYNAFLEKVKRTVFVDELTPLASKSVLESAFNQFGTVEDVILVPNYLGPKEIPMGVLVVMQTEEKAKAILDTLSQFPFMVAGIPRPVRAKPAKPEMFADRPKEPSRRVLCRWIDPNDPDFENAKKIKRLVQKHTAEAAFVLKNQLDEAEKLATKQSETATAHHKKFEMMYKLFHDGVAEKLANRYNINMRSFPYR